MAKTNVAGITKPKRHPKGRPYLSTFSLGSGENRRRETAYFATMPEAKDWLFAKRLQSASSLIKNAGTYSVPSLFRLWYSISKAPTIQPGTAITYEQTIKYLHKYLDIPVNHLSHLTAQQFFNRLSDKGLSLHTLKKVRSHMAAWTDEMMEERLWLSDPMHRIKIAEKPRALNKNQLLQPDELRQLTKYIMAQKLTVKDAPLVAIALQIVTGARSGELIGSLRANNLNGNQWTIDANWVLSAKQLGPTKTKNIRIVPLPNTVVDLIDHWMEIVSENKLTHPDGLLLVANRNGIIKPISQNDISYYVKKLQVSVLGRLPADTVSAHKIRASFISNLTAPSSAGGLGLSLPLVRKLVGHAADSSVTQNVYQTALESEMQQYNQILDQTFDRHIEREDNHHG